MQVKNSLPAIGAIINHQSKTFTHTQIICDFTRYQ
jgi:hypothetical protein